MSAPLPNPSADELAAIVAAYTLAFRAEPAPLPAVSRWRRAARGGTWRNPDGPVAAIEERARW